MNLHPIFVHFPIAFLTIYSLMEMVRLKKITTLPYWFYVKAMLVILGAASAYITLLSGEMIEEMFEEANGLVEVHSAIAKITTLLFTIIALLYILSWIQKSNLSFTKKLHNNLLWIFLIKLQKFILNTHLIIIFAFIGLLLITITGALGGIIAFGPDTDPLTKFIYEILIKAKAV